MNELLAYAPSILLAYSVFLLSILSPGPNVLAIMGTSMSVGRASGIALALGVASGSFVWASLTAFGLTALLATYAGALTAIKIAGGLFLLWLAWKSAKAAASDHATELAEIAQTAYPLRRYYFRGVAVQLTNPKAGLAWVAIMSLGMSEGAPTWVAIAIVGGTVFLSTLCHVLYAVLFSTAPMVRVYTKARRWIQGAMATFFTIAGLKLLLARS